MGESTLEAMLTLPDATRVILRAGDDRVSLIIEGSREDLIRVAFEDLQAVTTLHIPHPTRAIAATVRIHSGVWCCITLGPYAGSGMKCTCSQ